MVISRPPESPERLVLSASIRDTHGHDHYDQAGHESGPEYQKVFHAGGFDSAMTRMAMVAPTMSPTANKSISLIPSLLSSISPNGPVVSNPFLHFQRSAMTRMAMVAPTMSPTANKSISLIPSLLSSISPNGPVVSNPFLHFQ